MQVGRLSNLFIKGFFMDSRNCQVLGCQTLSFFGGEGGGVGGGGLTVWPHFTFLVLLFLNSAACRVKHGFNFTSCSVWCLFTCLFDSLIIFFSYVLYSYVLKHDDGRVSYPLVFIFISPQGKDRLLSYVELC